MLRLEVMEQVITCEGCDLHAQCTGPVFATIPQDGGIIAILGEAPGAQEDTAGAPFVGPAGKMLRQHLTAVGINCDEISFINTVSCYPNATPTWDQVHACAKNREDQLAVSGATHVLCVGKVATKAINPALDMKHGRARPWMQDGRFYMSTYHPAAALRNGNYEQAMADDISVFAEFVKPGADWHDFVRLTCSECPKDMYWMQENALTWCLEHVPGDDFAKAQARYARNIAAHESLKATALLPPTPPNPAEIDTDQIGKFRVGGMATSKKAAIDIVGATGTQRRKVYEAILNAPDGLTDDELVIATGISNDSCRPRRAELKDSPSGWVYDSGRTRPSDVGADMTVWLARPGG